MSHLPPEQRPPEPGAGTGTTPRSAGTPLSRPLGDAGGSYHRPRVKIITTEGEVAPTGATHTPPTPAPLPEKGSGLQLFLSVLAALAALIFLVLLLQKL